MLTIVAGALGSLPTDAQQLPPAVPPRFSVLPRPSETGKPVIDDPEFVAKAERDLRLGCDPSLSCRVQLLGAIEKNGAVMLRGKAFTW